MNTPAPNPQLLTMPGVARRTGTSVNRIRDVIATLESSGLVVKIGGIWIAVAENAEAIAKAVGPPRRSRA